MFEVKICERNEIKYLYSNQKTVNKAKAEILNDYPTATILAVTKRAW